MSIRNTGEWGVCRVRWDGHGQKNFSESDLVSLRQCGEARLLPILPPCTPHCFSQLVFNKVLNTGQQIPCPDVSVASLLKGDISFAFGFRAPSLHKLLLLKDPRHC